MKYILLIFSVFPLLAFAEVSDKMASIPSMWAQGITVAIVLLFLVRRYILSGIVGVFVVAFFTYASYDSFSDPHIGPAIIREQGTLYIVAAYGSVALMGAGLIAGIYLNRRRCKKCT